ncbi:MAG: hypothetical protein Roseis3KO_00510 [Roseivirga sp.]
MNQPRKLKIHRKFRARAWDYTTVPEIRLEGRWLEKLGFQHGQHVHIKQQRNKLIIILEEEQEK